MLYEPFYRKANGTQTVDFNLKDMLLFSLASAFYNKTN